MIGKDKKEEEKKEVIWVWKDYMNNAKIKSIYSPILWCQTTDNLFNEKTDLKQNCKF